MSYEVKKAQELIWFDVVAAGTVIVQVLASTDPDTVTDWKAYAIALASGTLRAAGFAVFNKIKAGK